MQPYMRPIYPGARIAGSAVTVLRASRRQLDAARRRRIVPPPATCWSSRCSAEAPRHVRRIAGDVAQCTRRARPGDRRRLPRRARRCARCAFPVWSRAMSAQGHGQGDRRRGERSGRLRRRARRPAGDVDRRRRRRRRRRAARTRRRGRRRRRRACGASEEVNRKRFAAGELGLDVYDMRGTLASRGLAYVDGPVDWPDPLAGAT